MSRDGSRIFIDYARQFSGAPALRSTGPRSPRGRDAPGQKKSPSKKRKSQGTAGQSATGRWLTQDGRKVGPAHSCSGVCCGELLQHEVGIRWKWVFQEGLCTVHWKLQGWTHVLFGLGSFHRIRQGCHEWILHHSCSLGLVNVAWSKVRDRSFDIWSRFWRVTMIF